VELIQSNGIKFYQFNSFKNQGLYHAVFTRNGGFSPYPWESLNFGASVGDDIGRVQKNKQLAFAGLGIDQGSIFDVYQIHSSTIVRTDRPRLPGEPHNKADGILTNTPGVSLLMRFADCVPILLFDPVERAIGLVHAGWIGTINRIVAKAIELMVTNFKSVPRNLIAAIGPSIGPDHYAVKSDVIELVSSNFKDCAHELIIEHQGKKHFDLWKANEITLRQSGVQNIENSKLCTYCKMDEFYSHRGEHGKTGRFGVVLGLSA
jgi:YfiH family protein